MQRIYVLLAYPIYIDFDHRMMTSENGLKEKNSNFTEPWLCNEATKLHSPSSYLFQLNTSSAPCYLLQVFLQDLLSVTWF